MHWEASLEEFDATRTEPYGQHRSSSNSLTGSWNHCPEKQPNNRRYRGGRSVSVDVCEAGLDDRRVFWHFRGFRNGVEQGDRQRDVLAARICSRLPAGGNPHFALIKLLHKEIHPGRLKTCRPRPLRTNRLPRSPALSSCSHRWSSRGLFPRERRAPVRAESVAAWVSCKVGPEPTAERGLTESSHGDLTRFQCVAIFFFARTSERKFPRSK